MYSLLLTPLTAATLLLAGPNLHKRGRSEGKAPSGGSEPPTKCILINKEITSCNSIDVNA